MLQRFSASVLGLAVLSNLWLSGGVQAGSTSSLTVTVDGLRNQRGQICFNLFSSSQGFPASNSRALQARCVKATTAPLVVTFQNLKVGNYAVAIVHDENGDGTINRNGLGIPTEGFGFSRNPRIISGPPAFGDAAVLVVGPLTTTEVRLQYLLGG